MSRTFSAPVHVRRSRQSSDPARPSERPSGLSTPPSFLLSLVPRGVPECGDGLAECFARLLSLIYLHVTLTKLVEPLYPRAMDGLERLVVRDRLFVLAPREEEIAQAEGGFSIAKSRLQLPSAHD